MIFPTPYHQHLQTTQDTAPDWSKTPPAKHDSHVFCYYRQLMINLQIVDISDIAVES